jgi:hypothetical protein
MAAAAKSEKPRAKINHRRQSKMARSAKNGQ